MFEPVSDQVGGTEGTMVRGVTLDEAATSLLNELSGAFDEPLRPLPHQAEQPAEQPAVPTMTDEEEEVVQSPPRIEPPSLMTETVSLIWKPERKRFRLRKR